MHEPQLPAITARIPTGADSVMNGMRQGSNPAGWLAITATALLLQACAEKPPSAPPIRVYAADVAGGAAETGGTGASCGAGDLG